MNYKGRHINPASHIGDFSRQYDITTLKDYRETIEYIEKRNQPHDYVIILRGNQQHVDSIVATDEDPKTYEQMREIIRNGK